MSAVLQMATNTGIDYGFPCTNTVELQWLEHLWNHKNMFETAIVRANEG